MLAAAVQVCASAQDRTGSSGGRSPLASLQPRHRWHTLGATAALRCARTDLWRSRCCASNCAKLMSKRAKAMRTRQGGVRRRFWPLRPKVPARSGASRIRPKNAAASPSSRTQPRTCGRDRRASGPGGSRSRIELRVSGTSAAGAAKESPDLLNSGSNGPLSARSSTRRQLAPIGIPGASCVKSTGRHATVG